MSDVEATVADLQHLFLGLNRLATRSRVRQALHPALTTTDAWLLEHLAGCGAARLSTLAGWQAVDRSTMSTQVKRLEAAGLVRRTVDPSDRRAVLVSLTSEGEEASRRVREAAAAFFRDAVAQWTPGQRAQLVESLTRLTAAIESRLDP